MLRLVGELQHALVKRVEGKALLNVHFGGGYRHLEAVLLVDGAHAADVGHFGHVDDGVRNELGIGRGLRRDLVGQRDFGRALAGDADVLAGEVGDVDADARGASLGEAGDLGLERKDGGAAVREAHDSLVVVTFGKREARIREANVLRRREAELRREAGVAWHAPVRVPARRVLKHHGEKVFGLRREALVLGDEPHGDARLGCGLRRALERREEAAAAQSAAAASQVLTEPMIVLYAGAAQAAISANVSRAAAMVASITSSVCMIETKPASKTDGAK